MKFLLTFRQSDVIKTETIVRSMLLVIADYYLELGYPML